MLADHEHLLIWSLRRLCLSEYACLDAQSEEKSNVMMTARTKTNLPFINLIAITAWVMAEYWTAVFVVRL